MEPSPALVELRLAAGDVDEPAPPAWVNAPPPAQPLKIPPPDWEQEARERAALEASAVNDVLAALAVLDVS